MRCVHAGTTPLSRAWRISERSEHSQDTELNSGRLLTTLHTFTGADGFAPVASLLQASDGNFYGTTSGGGANGKGTLFVITPAGAFTSLHSFTGADGSDPEAGLTQAPNGYLYGTTQWGGAIGDGTTFL